MRQYSMEIYRRLGNRGKKKTLCSFKFYTLMFGTKVQLCNRCSVTSVCFSLFFYFDENIRVCFIGLAA